MFARKIEEASCSEIRPANLRRLLFFWIVTLFVIPLGLIGHFSFSEAKKDPSAHSPSADFSENFEPLGVSRLTNSLSTSVLQTGGTQVAINFDELPAFTDVSARYQNIRFTSPGLSVYSWPAPHPKSSPNAITRGTLQGWNVQNNHFADLIIEFPQAVNNLKFFITGGDNFGTVAYLDYYQNGNLTQQNLAIGGPGPSHQPIPIDFQTPGIGNITKIKIHNITDHLGLTFDEFTFTVPAASPTPTPTPIPTPPPAPTNLSAVPDEESITLHWTASPGATRYNVKRTGDCSTDEPNFAAKEAALTDPNALMIAPVGTTSFPDMNLCSDFEYEYVVSAVGPGGESPNSAPIKRKPLPKPGCTASATPTPPPGPTGGHGWTMDYNFSPQDGLVISEVKLNGKRMADQISVPYFRIFTSKSGNTFGPTRGELTPAHSGPGMRSRLVGYGQRLDNDKIQIVAKYAIDRIPGTPRACLNITQKYEFYRAGAGPPDLQGNCEPSGTVSPCHRFRPMIEYTFIGGPDESLKSLNMPMRLHFQNTTDRGNTVALTRDIDNLLEAIPRLNRPFRSAFNPLGSSWWSQAIVRRSDNSNKDAHKIDNFHQTNQKVAVTLPGLRILGWVPQPPPGYPLINFARAGCPECVHLHWRWASFFAGPNFRKGVPLVPPGSDQTVDIQVVPFKNVFQNYHPTDYITDLYRAGEPLRNPTRGVNEPYDVVLWYSPTGFANSDKFFWHTAWFTPQRVEVPNNVSVSKPEGEASSSSGTSDGPVSVTFGSVYETGTTNFFSYDLNTLPPLPQGYTALNNEAYLIGTTALVGGPHTVNFSAGSIADQNTFDNLRIFFAEPDPFDPERPVWREATIRAPEVPAPNFAAKTLSARTDTLGVYVIGKLVQPVPPNTDVANLRVSCSDSADPIAAENDLTYTLTVTNEGPQAATEVGLKNPLSPDVTFVSATPSQGTCKEFNGAVYCALSSLPAGGSATVTLVVTPTEGTVRFPVEGKIIANTALVRAKEGDNDSTNDWIAEETRVLPSPNLRPTVEIASPAGGAMFIGPATIAINAIATDTDGTITNVDFFDNGEFIGTGTPGAGNSYSVTSTLSACAPPGGHHAEHDHEDPCNVHTFRAVATDNGGRQTISGPVDVIVNGTATISINSPISGALLNPNSQIILSANASHPSGFLSEVEFFANGQSLGHGTANGGSQYTFAWNNVSAGIYSIFAIAWDGSGTPTMSAPVNITVNTRPTVTMSSPADGTVFPSNTNISVSAIAQSAHTTIARVDFYSNGTLIATSNELSTDKFTATWRNLPDGIHSLTAVATDNLGLSTTSAPITVGVNTPATSPGQFIWFDDALPAGAVTPANQEGWFWVDANPGAFSGTKSHQSRDVGTFDPALNIHQHYFENATAKFQINPGDKLFTYVFLDRNSMPRQLMLQWRDATGWEHRAYWGQSRISLGVEGTSSRLYMGPLPAAGRWVRLEVPANLVGLEGSILDGMKFTLEAGRATFDLVGKTTANAPPLPVTAPGDFVWIEDQLPAGAVPKVIDDEWRWVPGPTFSGQSAHQSYFSSGDDKRFRSHSFTNAQTPMHINPGDVLFAYVYLGDPDPNHSNPNTPDQIMLQWYDGASWSHGAFWGMNYMDKRVPNMGVFGTEAQRYMGGLKSARSGGCGIPNYPGWCRLEVPASYVGLEGKSVTGMAFSAYREGKNPFVTWDRSGKTSMLSEVPRPLNAQLPVFRFASQNRGYAFETNELPPSEHYLERSDVFFVYPNPAAGTVPMYRFRRPTTFEYFYARNREDYDGNGWQFEGIAFYVYPDASTPGTVPLYVYKNPPNNFYVLTADQFEAAGKPESTIWAYVHASSAPAQPSNLTDQEDCSVSWADNSGNESGFQIQHWIHEPPQPLPKKQQLGPRWVDAATVGANVTTLPAPCYYEGASYRVRSYNSFGYSEFAYTSGSWSEGLKDPAAANAVPGISITNPRNGEIVNQNSTIAATVYDYDGNGTIVNVAFFANGVNLGTVTDAPYVFPWNNVAPGAYTLTAVAKDNNGATTTSEAVTVNVGKFDQEITFSPISDKTFGDAPFGLNAIANSNLPVTFAVVSGPATVSGNSVTITGAGTVTVRASQPGDASYYAAANVDRTFNVAKAAATITLSNLSQTYDGSPRIVTATTSPANLTGVSITYDGSTTAPTNAGTYAIVASLTHENYSAANATGTLSVAPASQTISFTAPADKTYGDAPFALTASSSSNLPVSFSIVSGPATLSGNTLTITGAGSVTVRASQSGNANYNAAAAVDRTFNVAKASATITLSNLSHVYDGTVKSATATTNPAGLSGVGISYSGPALTPINAGTYSVVATLTNANYTAPNATASLTVAKANPVITWQSPADIPVGTPLSATQLNATANVVEGTFAYSPPAGTVLNVGNNQTLSVTFTPTIYANYNTVSKTVSINVATAVPLSDDFNDNSLDSSRWTLVVPNSPVTVSEQGQQLRITIPPNTSGYNGIVSTSTYDLRGSTVEVEMAQPISQAGWCENFIQVSLDAANYFLIDAGAGSMVFRSMIAGNNDQTVLPVFNPVEHRYWRIRHDQGTSTIYFETSPDRVIWTSRKTAAVGFSLTAMRVHLLAGAWGTGNSNPGTAGFDNVRLVTNETGNALSIANSGFELPVLAANGYQYAPTGGAWTFTSGGGVTGNSSGFTAANAPAPELNQVAFLQGGAASTISQPVAGFQANTNYVVTFAAAQRAYYTGQDFQVYLDSVLLGTFRPTSMGYVYYSTAPFSTTAGTHTLKFVGLNSSGGDNTALIDNVRITQSSAVQSVSLFSDEFNSTSLDATKWTVTDPARVTANGQQLQIALLPNTAAYHTAYSNSTYNLTGRSVQVELAQSISQAGWCENYILVMLDGNNYLLLHSGSGSMVLRSMVNGANDQTVLQGGFNPAVHHYWRIRHDQVSNTIKFETSPDAVTWTIYKSAAAGFSLTSLRFYLYAGCWGTSNGNPGTAKFDNFRFLDPAYLDSPVTLPGTIEIENYDNGDTGLGYYDTSSGTHGQDYDQPPNYPPPTFRQPTNVDLYKASIAYSSRYLIVLQAGDWMKYSVNVIQAGNYTLHARIAWGGAPGGTFHIEVDGVDKTGPIQIPDTGWSLQMISKTLQLPSGVHSLKVVADTNGANGYTGDIDYLYFRLNP